MSPSDIKRRLNKIGRIAYVSGVIVGLAIQNAVEGNWGSFFTFFILALALIWWSESLTNETTRMLGGTR